MSEPKKIGPELIISILREAQKPLTTRELQQEVLKRVPFCISSNVVALNLMRLGGIIQGKRAEVSWIWWVEDKPGNK